MAENPPEESSAQLLDGTVTPTGSLLSKSDPNEQLKPPDKKPSLKKSLSFKLPDRAKPNTQKPKQPPSNAPFIDRLVSFVQRTFIAWFDLNLEYISTTRGILNISHVVLSMLTMSLMSASCQAQGDLGFYCKSSDTFLFVIACAGFVMSLLFLVCCLFSINTDQTLRKTAFEFSFHLMFFFFYLCSAINLTAVVVGRNAGKPRKEHDYNATLAGGVFGIMTCIAHGMSAVWFYLYNRRYGGQSNAANPDNSPKPLED